MAKKLTGEYLECTHCKKSVYVPKYRIENFKFCSRKCGALHCRIEHTSICLICKTEFTHISSRANKAKYCSRKCYYESLKNKGNKKFTCKHCGKEFFDHKSVNRIYCSKACVNKEEKSIWNTSFTCIRKKLFIRGKVEKCDKCGYNECKEILGIHHKDKNPKNNNLDNLIILCPNCHSIEHLKHIVHKKKTVTK